MQYKSYQIEDNINKIKENISLFYGENLGLKNEFKKNIIKTHAEYEKIRFFQEEVIKNKSIIEKEINNLSLFEKNKVFFIDQVNDKILELIKEFENKINEHKIIIFADILEKKSKLRNHFEKSKYCACVPCYDDNEITIKNIIKKRLVGYEGLTTYNVNLLLEHTNLDRAKLENELTKITSCFENRKIETEKLENLLNTRFNDDFNKLKNEAFLGNKSRTNELLSDTVMEPDKNIFYINLINQRLNKLSETLSLNKTGIEDAVNSLKPPIFWKEKPDFISQVKKWDKKKINKMFEMTYNLEKEIKSNNLVNKNILIKKLILDTCEVANS